MRRVLCQAFVPRGWRSIFDSGWLANCLVGENLFFSNILAVDFIVPMFGWSFVCFPDV